MFVFCGFGLYFLVVGSNRKIIYCQWVTGCLNKVWTVRFNENGQTNDKSDIF